jgi:hypothetical protein
MDLTLTGCELGGTYEYSILYPHNGALDQYQYSMDLNPVTEIG